MRVTVARLGKYDHGPRYHQAILKELRTEYEKAKKALVKEFQKVVKDWEHKPEFASRAYVTPQAVSIHVWPTGDNAKIWTFVSRGTKEHRIPKTGETLLAFHWGGPGSYVAKTQPRGAVVKAGGGGEFPLVYRTHVHHPGAEAREFEERIGEEFQHEFQVATSKAVQEGAMQAWKG